MELQQATQEIKARWKELYPADGNGRGKGIICPLCGSGSGKNGTGITERPNNRNHFLKCWNGGCSFETGGSVIDLYMMENGMNPQTDFSRAVDELAAKLNISIDPHRNSTAAEDFAEAAPAAGNPSFSGEPSSTAAAEPTAEPPANFQKYYQQCMKNLRESAEAQAYLQRRGISLDTAAKCCIGFDPAWISPTTIKRQQERGSNWLPDPKPVIILPSTLQHYVARDIRPDLDEQQRKFAKMNEGEPGIFGGYRAFSSSAENIFITEGAFDALSIMETGATAIALNSTSNAEKLLKQLEKQPTQATLIICLDNDAAGKATAAKLKEGLKRLNIPFLVENVSGEYKDPNEFLCKDREAFAAAVMRAITEKPDNTSLYIDAFMVDDLTRRQEIGKKATGFPNLDEKIGGGLRPGLILLGAISSLGKTTFCSQLADGLAANGSDVIYFSLEQSRLEMVSKSLARQTYLIDAEKAVTGGQIMDGCKYPIIADAARSYKTQVGDRVSIIEAGMNCDTQYITGYVRNYHKKTGKRPVVIVDYLQVLKPGELPNGRKQDRRETVEECLTQLVLLKRELDLTILAIVSLNRNNYLQPFDFEAIKETGLAEYSADVVWGLQLQCLDEDLFQEEKKLKEKRDRIREEKKAIPRMVKLCSVKHRGQQAVYDCYFQYFPQYDIFVPMEAPAQNQNKHQAAKRFPAGGKVK